ncbi:single-stranded-DNA-specific exonuclease RecJ [Patescibacteria group bacterium]
MSHNWKITTSLKSTSLKDRHQEIMNSLLKQRGLTTKKLQQDFFAPPTPQKIKPSDAGIKTAELKKAITRINKAKKNQELIYIYGDYDADGVSATSILWESLYRLGINAMPYIPTREDKTRGLSKLGIDQIIDQAGTKPDLIITVDNGITSFKACQYAKTQNIDIIITDHHQPKKDKLPKVKAIVHSTDLAGAGVAWFLAYQLDKQATNSLDITALGTIADMVPLLKANRSLAKFGLAALKKSARPGVQALAQTANIQLEDLQAYQVGYTLAPRLNAMARLEHAIDSVRLLCTKDQNKANNIARTLENTNLDRQNLTTDMIKHAETQVDKTKKLIFIADKSYHEGIVGLVAGRLMEKFHRPAVVMAVGKTHSKASARSIDKFNVVKAFEKLKVDIVSFGGHPLAGGLTMMTKDIAKVRKQLEAMAEKQLKQEDLVKTLDIDCQISLKDINQDLFDQLEKFKPFGMNNPDPVFATKQVNLTSFRPVGQNQTHLKLKVEDFDAIAFNQGYLAEKLIQGQPVDICYTIDQNQWQGKTNLQLKIKSINFLN